MFANIVANGDFSANASSFTSWPGYLGGGANPPIQAWGFTDRSDGIALAGINGPTTGVGTPFAPTSTVGINNFAFIQNGAMLLQGLPTLQPNQQYRISVAAANRANQPNASGRIQIGDATTVFYTSGDQSFSGEAFRTITATFATPATFNGTPSIQLYGFSAGGDAVAYTHVVLEIDPNFPRFRAEGADLTALDSMLRHFHPACNMDVAPTYALAWLPPAMLWVGESPQVSTSPTRARIANRIGTMRISADGYVSCHQHEGLAHSEGWPFPLPNQGGGIGYFFTMAGQPYGAGFGNHPITQVDDWQLSGASGTTLDPGKGWSLDLTSANATITSPAFDLNAFVSPFIRVKWDATGLPEGCKPYLEWTTAEDLEFSPSRRMAFPEASTSSQAPILDFDIPVHEITDAKGRISRLRLGFGNPVPGKVTIQRLFSAVDSRHTINNPNYLIAGADFFEWTGDKAWLSSNLAKMRRAADYMISEFKVRETHLLRTPWIGHDGRSGLEILPDGSKVIHHGAGVGGNYWDLIPFGGDDVHGTIYLYSALRRMARIEQFVAADAAINPPAAGLDSASLNTLADAVRVKFQQTFWNPETKRFAPKDDQGRFRDYGFTFLNNEAIYYGLASDMQACEILSWLEGARVVAGDTSQGADIYRWRFGPRATTKRNIEYYAYVWSNPESIQFGDQVQDGGVVLGFTYHDLMARIHHLGPDNAWQRLGEILAWYDEVEAAGGPRAYYSVPGRGTLQGGGIAGGLGIDQEFYESVLTPAIILDGFIGFSVRPDGFDLAPRLPTAIESLGVSNVSYRDLRWDIDLAPASIAFRVKSGNVDAPLRIRLPEGAWTATFRAAAASQPQTVKIASGPQGFELPAGPLHELLITSATATAR